MTDDEFRSLFRRFKLCLERPDTTLDQFEKPLSDGFDWMNARLKGIEHRLMHQADTWVVSWWGVTLAMCIAAALVLAKL